MTLPMIFPLTCHNHRQGIPIKLASLKHALYLMWLVGYLDWLYLLPHIDIIPLDKGELLTFCIHHIGPFGTQIPCLTNFILEELWQQVPETTITPERTNQLRMILADTPVKTVTKETATDHPSRVWDFLGGGSSKTRWVGTVQWQTETERKFESECILQLSSRGFYTRKTGITILKMCPVKQS